ncbi:MAG: M16 family metallopeptidase [Longimicrobiales bacterium]
MIDHLAERGGHGRDSVPSTSLGRGSLAEAMIETRLDNGVRVLSEQIPGVRSAAIGVWVRQGAAHETDADTGVSHLLEHMVFKGTERRSALEIADSLEALGGSLDAYTSREHTSYQARVLDEHMPIALDVLSDLVLSPTLADSDLELEREVVLEEIAQVEDTPDDLVFEMHTERLWNGHPYGRSILGTKESVTSMEVGTLRSLHADRYVGQNLVVAAAGNVEHEDFAGRVAGYFADVSPGDRSEQVVHPSATASGFERINRSTAQTHIVFGTEAPPHSSDDRYALILLSSVLGGGMSSRLFQKVREELGLCYSIFTFQSFYHSAGLVGVYVGTRPATAEQASEAVREELKRVATEGLTDIDLDRIKQQVKGQVMLSLESTGARLHRLASFALHDEPFRGLDDVLARIDAVARDDILRVATHYFDPTLHLELRLGPDEAVSGAV